MERVVKIIGIRSSAGARTTFSAAGGARGKRKRAQPYARHWSQLFRRAKINARLAHFSVRKPPQCMPARLFPPLLLGQANSFLYL